MVGTMRTGTLLFMLLLVCIVSITGCANQTLQVQKTEQNRTNQEVKPVTANHPVAVLETTMGTIKIELFNDTMPITSGNFEKLVRQGFYDGVVFHRVMPNFMIQGGDPTGTGTGGPGYKIKDEFAAGNHNGRGTISMANAGPNTGGSQFFINVVDNGYLDAKHPVFGKVVAGLDVADAISKVPTGAGNKPVTPVVIKKATME
jgi:peptidylprolyl isomerase